MKNYQLKEICTVRTFKPQKQPRSSEVVVPRCPLKELVLFRTSVLSEIFKKFLELPDFRDCRDKYFLVEKMTLYIDP